MKGQNETSGKKKPSETQRAQGDVDASTRHRRWENLNARNQQRSSFANQAFQLTGSTLWANDSAVNNNLTASRESTHKFSIVHRK